MSYDAKFLFVLWVFDVIALTFGVAVFGAKDKKFDQFWVGELLTFVVIKGVLLVLSVIIGRNFVYHAGFAVLRLVAHSIIAVCAPLAVVRGVLLLRRRQVLWGLTLIFASVMSWTLYGYGCLVEISWLEDTRYVVTTSRMNENACVRIAVLADLQTDAISAYEREVFARLDLLRPDLIVMPGDFLQIIRGQAQAVESERKKLIELLNGLQHVPRYGIVAVFGDVDYDKDLFRGSRVMVLDGRVAVLGESPAIQIVGLTNAASRKVLSQRVMSTIEALSGPTIVLGHAPDFAANIVQRHEKFGTQDGSVPFLGIAGHTHGGQIVIPGLGPLMTFSRLPRAYASGCHRLGAATLFVSRGIGHECGLAPRIRVNCRPELALLVLRGDGQ